MIGTDVVWSRHAKEAEDSDEGEEAKEEERQKKWQRAKAPAQDEQQPVFAGTVNRRYAGIGAVSPKSPQFVPSVGGSATRG